MNELTDEQMVEIAQGGVEIIDGGGRNSVGDFHNYMANVRDEFRGNPKQWAQLCNLMSNIETKGARGNDIIDGNYVSKDEKTGQDVLLIPGLIYKH